MIVMIKNIAD